MEFSWGVAHDFSNLIQVIMGFAEMLRMQHKDHPETLESLDEIITATTRARAMVADLLVIGRRNPSTPRAADAAELLRRLAAPLQQQMGERYTLHVTVDTGPQYAILDPDALTRTLTLLCAYAAAGLREGGTITVRAEPARLEPDGTDCLRISVQDTGPGCDPAWVPRMCEPFFMKRHAKRGTGWELPVAAGLVEQQQGVLEVQTAPDGGTTMHVYLPAARAEGAVTKGSV